MTTNWNRTRVKVTFKGNSLINTPDTKHIPTTPAMKLKEKREFEAINYNYIKSLWRKRWSQ